jgi:hypothetical protein
MVNEVIRAGSHRRNDTPCVESAMTGQSGRTALIGAKGKMTRSSLGKMKLAMTLWSQRPLVQAISRFMIRRASMRAPRLL